MIIFEGEDVLAKSGIVNDRTDRVYVTFTSRDGTLKSRTGFGESFFAAKDENAVHFVSKRNYWWQTAEMTEAIAAVRPLLAPFRSVITYGSSMGGHGALLFSRPLGATHVLALVPQFAINGRGAPWHSQWAKDTEGRPELFSMEEGLSPEAEVVLAYDPFCGFDVAHLAAIETVRPVTRLKAPMGGHAVTRLLAETRLLSPLVLGMGDPDIAPRTQRQYKALRAESLRYWIGLSARVRQASKPRLRAAVNQRLLALLQGLAATGGNVDMKLVTQAAATTLPLFDVDSFEALCAGLIERYPLLSQPHAIRARGLRHFGLTERALAAANRAVKLARKDYNLRLLRAEINLELGRPEQAKPDLELCLAFRNTLTLAFIARVEELHAPLAAEAAIA